MARQIPLSPAGFFALVDDDLYDELTGPSYRKWYYLKTSDGSEYAQCSLVLPDGRLIRMLMHRAIMQAQPGEEVDHKNWNGLDNQRENLRLCTSSQNKWNQRKTRGVSQFKGVYWNKEKRKWQAQIGYLGRHLNLGRYDSEEMAGLAYNLRATELFGEFAALNILPGGIVLPERKRRPPKSSQYRGVYWFTDRQAWYAQLRVQKQKFGLGPFPTEHEAVLAYDAAARQHGRPTNLLFLDSSASGD